MTYNSGPNTIPDAIPDEERLFRVVFFLWWNAKSKSVSPAAFIDDKGVSVDRMAHRSEEKVIGSLKHRFRDKPRFDPKKRLKSIASITAGKCREINTFVFYSKSNRQLYHSSIWESKSVIKISFEKAFMLSRKVHLDYIKEESFPPNSTVADN